MAANRCAPLPQMILRWSCAGKRFIKNDGAFSFKALANTDVILPVPESVRISPTEPFSLSERHGTEILELSRHQFSVARTRVRKHAEMRAFHFNPRFFTAEGIAGKRDHTDQQGHQFAFHIGKEHSPDKIWTHRPHRKRESIAKPAKEEEGPPG